MTDAIFIPDGDLLIPQANACGPWFPGVQHGGAISGLLARAIERVPSDAPMFMTRLSIDMSRQVPMAATRVETELVRDGRRVQAIDCRYVVDGEVVGRATATRIRIDESVVPDDKAITLWPEDRPPAAPDDLPEMKFTRTGVDFVRNFSMRRLESEPGRAVSWLRLEKPFVEGEVTSPAVLLSMVADMIPSAGGIFDFDKYLSINPDLSVNIHRLPEGDWIGSSALVYTSRFGVGQTDAQLFDEHGAVGRSIKSLLIDRR